MKINPHQAPLPATKDEAKRTSAPKRTFAPKLQPIEEAALEFIVGGKQGNDIVIR